MENRLKKIIVNYSKFIYKEKRRLAYLVIYLFSLLTIGYGAYLSLGYLINFSEATYYVDTYIANIFYIVFYFQYLAIFGLYIIKYRQSKILLFYLLSCLVWFY